MITPLLDVVVIKNLPSYLECRRTSHAGRAVFTKEHIAVGSKALAEQPYAHSIHYRYKYKTCDHCLNFTEEGCSLPCPCLELCGVHYCSPECRDLSSHRHSLQCGLIKQTNSSRQCKKANAALSMLFSICSNDTDISDVLSMMYDSSKAGLRQYQLSEAQFRGLSHEEAAAVTCRESEGVYAAALATQRLNAIGLFDEYGEELGSVLCPMIAMVNHSCIPNCQLLVADGLCCLIALRDIVAGEELSYSYVSLQGSAIDRRKSIYDTWQFSCQCGRCTGNVDCAEFDLEHVCYCGSVSVVVQRSVAEECVCNVPKIKHIDIVL